MPIAIKKGASPLPSFENMAKKKKKTKKTSPSAQNQLQNLSFKDLIERGERFIAIRRPRDAVSVLRFALKKHGQTEEVTQPLFRAYMARAAQLRDKGMHVEARSLQKTAQEFLPSMADLSTADMLACMALSSDREAFDLYVSHARIHGSSEAAERQLADCLVKNGCWDCLQLLDDDWPLKRHAEAVKPAVDEMAAGRWETALEMLKPVSRTSPFASIRLFCRAMVAFYAEDDAGALAALSRIPEDFFLGTAAADLRTVLDRTGNLTDAASEATLEQKRTEALERLDCLWDVPVHLTADMAAVIRDLDKERIPEARKGLGRCAEAMTPSSPERALFVMLQALWRMVVEGRLEMSGYRKLIKDLLSRDRADLLLTKVAIMDREDYPFTTTGNYLNLLHKEFPGPGEQAMVRSAVLEGLAGAGTAHAADRFSRILRIDEAGVRKHRTLFGIRSDPTAPEMIAIELAMESARVDPGNRRAYELLATLPRSGRDAKTEVEKGLQAMVKHFPGDPYPYLELARLYYERSAFRKAEKVLQDALAQAPYDSQVVEKNALACLIAAEKNLNRGKLHLVEKDVARSGDFDAKKLAPYILEKQMLLRLYQGETPDAFLDEMLANRPLLEQLRTLSTLLMDLEERDFGLKKKDLRKLELALNRRLTHPSDLGSEDISRLLLPLDQSLLQIYPTTQIAPILLSKNPDMVKGLTDADAIDLYDKILSPESWKSIKKDIKRRIPKAKQDHRILFSFFQEVLRQIEKKDFRSKDFTALQAEASGPLTESLRALSRKLAPHAPQPLKQALEMFQFEMLDRPLFPFGPGLEALFDGFDDELFDDLFDDADDDDELFDDDEDDEDDDDFPMPGFLDPDEIAQLAQLVKDLEGMRKKGVPVDTMPVEMIQGMLDEIEDMVDELAMRGLPETLILAMRDMMDVAGSLKKGMHLMGRFMELTGGKPRLSREAHILLYGKKKG